MKKINMGCGWRNFGKDWIHIDGGDYEHLDYKSIVDLSQFEDNSIDLIYSSHVIEYFDREEVKQVLKEWRRILKPNAVLRLAVPDFRSIVTLYYADKFPLENFLGPLYGKMNMESETIYHKTVYDFISLKKVLEELDFREIKLYNWENTEHSNYDDHSQAFLPKMDKKNGTLISLNVECVK
jgi:predicted SAM-dependent methyltransferase